MLLSLLNLFCFVYETHHVNAFQTTLLFLASPLFITTLPPYDNSLSHSFIHCFISYPISHFFFFFLPYTSLSLFLSISMTPYSLHSPSPSMQPQTQIFISPTNQDCPTFFNIFDPRKTIDIGAFRQNYHQARYHSASYLFFLLIKKIIIHIHLCSTYLFDQDLSLL